MAPCRVICTTERSVVFDVDGLHNVVPVNRVLLKRTSNEGKIRCNVTEDVTDNDNQREATTDVSDECGYTQPLCKPETKTRKKFLLIDVYNGPQDYVVQKLVGYYMGNEETLDRVRWLGYSADEDT